MSELQDQLKKTVKSLSNNSEFSNIAGADNKIDKKEFEELKLPPTVGKKLFEHLSGLDDETDISKRDIRIALKTLSFIDEIPKKERTPKSSKTALEVIQEMENERVIKKLDTQDIYTAKSGRVYQIADGKVFYNSQPKGKDTWGCISDETAYYKTDNKFIKLYAVAGTDRISVTEDLKFVLYLNWQVIKPEDGIYKLPGEQSYFKQVGDDLEHCDASGTLRKEFIANLIKKLETEKFIVEHDPAREPDFYHGEIRLKIAAPKNFAEINKLSGFKDLKLQDGMVHLVGHGMNINIYERTGLFKIDGTNSGGTLSVGRSIDQAVVDAKSIRDAIIGKTESLNKTPEQINKKIVEDMTAAISNKDSFSVKKIIDSSSSLGSLIRPAIWELVNSRSDKLSFCGCLLALRLKDEEMISHAIKRDEIFDVIMDLKRDDYKFLHITFLEELKRAVDNNSSQARHLLMLTTNSDSSLIREALKPVSKFHNIFFVAGGEEILANYRYSSKGQNVDFINEANEHRKIYKEGTWQNESLARFSQARRDGFDFPARLRDSISNQNWNKEIHNNSLCEPKQNQKVAVLLVCRTDLNGAFYNIGERVSELKREDYHVLYREIGSKEEFIATTKELASKKKADLLLIGGHSYKHSTDFGQSEWPGTESLTTQDEQELVREGVGKLLKDNGRIVFAACSVGEGKAEAVNMTNMMRAIFPQAAEKGIWSMTKPGNINSLKFDSEGVLEKVQFTVKEEETYRATLDDISKYMNIA